MEESSGTSSSCTTRAISSQQPRLFREMKPRVGSIYQTKVGKFSARRIYQSSRPCPEKYSIEYPHRIEDGDQNENRAIVEANSSVSLGSQGTLQICIDFESFYSSG
jgi:hypothetical protein